MDAIRLPSVGSQTQRQRGRPPSVFRLAWRAAWRDGRAGELRLLMVALVVAVAAIACVGFLADRMRQALQSEARQLMGADWVLGADRPIPEAIVERARAAGLSTVRTVNFPSMVIGPDVPQLASVKAVSEGYPLRGRLRVTTEPGGPDEAATGIPAPGTAWADAQLLSALGMKPGETLQLGDATFRVERIITLEPDRGASFVNFAPRILIGMGDLPATRLLQAASRANWRLLVAGAPEPLRAFAAQVRPAAGQRVESLEEGRPELRATLDRAERFLSLVALLSSLVAAVAIALAARRFTQRHTDGFAVMRALGMTQRRLLGMLACELALVGLAGSLVGLVVGLGAQFGLASLLAPLVGLSLPAPGVLPALQSLAAGMLLLAGFALVPVMRLAGVPALRVLRRELGPPTASVWLTGGVALLAFGLLVRWFAGDDRLAAYTLAGFVGGALLFGLVAWLLVRSVAPLRRLVAGRPRAGLLRLALAAWSRRQGSSIVQTVALAVALMALMLLTVVRSDLLDGWRQASPADAPNRFVINIQPDQREGVEALLARDGVGRSTLYPMVRGRLIAVNGEATGQGGQGDDDVSRARRALDREYNLSYMSAEPTHNRTVAGRWLDPDKDEVSVEQGIAKALGLEIGDRLRFDVAGEQVEATVSGIRKLAWDSMQVNFFMILSPAVLRDMPQTLITSFHLPPQRAALQTTLVQRFPNLTVFDTSNILRQVQTMLDQVSRAVEFLFLFTLAAGLLVLYAALVGSRDERLREAAILRALGASRRQLARSQLLELGLTGGMAGLLAAIGALACGALLAREVFRFPYDPRWMVLPLGVVVGAACAIAAGWLGLRGILRSPPIDSLRA